MKKKVILLSTADWNNPSWTNKQHVAMELHKQGFQILYIESLGIRNPTFKKQDIKRILSRLYHSFQLPKKYHTHLWVWSPIVLPFAHYRLIRLINRIILNLLLNFYRITILKAFKKDILFWTYNPITNYYFNLKKYFYTVYHCVDDIKTQPRMPREWIEKNEKSLCKKVNIIFTTSITLQRACQKYNDNTHYFSNVADYNHFSQGQTKNKENHANRPKDLMKIKFPIIGFIGAISQYKVDFDLLVYTAQQLENYEFILIGKIGEGDPTTNINTLRKIKNIHLLGHRPYKKLPSYLKYFSVALLPNHINEYTQSMFPMKFFEYLSTGTPVVATNLKSLNDFKQFAYLSKTKEEFVENIKLANSTTLEQKQNLINLAKKYTYKSRTDAMLKLIEKRNTQKIKD